MATSTPARSNNIASLADKVALITGGSSGLGRAIATAYAAAGAYIVNADLTPAPPRAPIIAEKAGNADLTTPTVDLINHSWPSARSGVDRAAFVKCNVTDEESVKAAVAFAVKTFGRLDVLVNNAGISAETSAKDYTGARRRVHELDVSILDRSLAVNVRGVWLFTKHATAQFLAQEPHPSFGYSHSGADTDADTHRGWIVNIASALASAGLAGSASYCASKGAVLQLTRATAIEYASDGIHINALQPGFTDTSLLETTYSMAEGGKEGVEAWLKAVHPLGRTGRPEDIARAAVFLAGDGAGWITGHGLVVDGGFLAQ